MKFITYWHFLTSRISQTFFVFKKVSKIVWQINKKYLLVLFILNFLLGISTLPVFIIEKNIIDAVVKNIGNPFWQQVISSLLLLVALRVGLQFFQSSIHRILWFLESSLSRLFSARLELLIGLKMTELDMATIETSKFKDKFDKIERESSRRAWALIYPLGGIMGNFSSLISAFSLLVFFKPWVALLIFFLSLPQFLVDARFIKEEYDFVSWSSPKQRLWGWISNQLTRARNFFEVKLLNITDYLTGRLREIQNQVLDSWISIRRKRQSLRIWSSFPLAIFLFGFNFYLVILAIIEKISVGSVEMYIRATTSFQSSMSELVRSVLEFYENYLYVRDLTWFLNLKPKLSFGKEEIRGELREGINVENLYFKYQKTAPWTIQGIDLKIKPGESIAIVGENGAGKTTLVKLICHFYQSNKGHIYLDGVNIAALTKESLYQRISVLFQDFQHFPYTARESIGFGNINKVNDLKEIAEWAKKTDIHQFISSLPLKYENPLVRDFEKGIELSAGQWQRIGLARALMKQASIIILDEPTSNVDPQAEEKIFGEIQKLTGEKRILILISHRFSTVRRADKIYVMEKGRFIEAGSHEQLMKLKGKYAKLFMIQAKYYQ
ncbi:MAG TPA: ABC transporter ATP-binding protein [Candidatus Bathyarchaeia archaeon]|nr:ABC transporter ATP-binding protein [Candidatus Bathyarchaeia archaeon]